MRDGDIVKIAVIICAAVLACSASVILLNGKAAADNSIPDYFGLSSTKLTLSTEDADGYTLGTWSLPKDKSYSDISWSTSDGSVATVTEGKIVGVSAGTATITAELGSYKDTCLVTVVNGVVESRNLAYNAYSEKFDFAELTGDAFEDGYLSVAFNANNAMVITLAGYAPLWLTQNSSFTGNATADFKSIAMTLKQGENVIADGLYVNEYKSHSPFWDLGKSKTVTSTSETSMLTADLTGMSYGFYTVEFVLKTEYDLHTYTLTGTIAYQEGDGYFDTSGTYARSYAWRFGTTSSDTTAYSVTVDYPYSDYWNGYYKNTKLLDTETMRNYKAYDWVTEFATSTESVKKLSEAVKNEYPGSQYDTDQFAEFVLAFGQIGYEYGYDYAQYIRGTGDDAESTDYWAYSDQTIFSGFGDCEDTSILIASLLKALGYSTACVVLPSHMTFAVALEDTSYLSTVTTKTYSFEDSEKKYYLCETTVHAPLVYQKPYENDYTWAPYLVSGYPYTDYPVGIISSDYEGEEFTHYPL